MKEILSLVDEVLEEHQGVFRCVLESEKAAEDVCASLFLEQAKEQVMPGRFADQRQGMQKLQASVETLGKWLEEHFQREEQALLVAFQRYASKVIASALSSLLIEHEEVRERIARLKQDIAELLSEDFSRDMWQGKAWGIRAYINHTARLLEAHAESEKELLLSARQQLIEKKNNVR